MRRKERHIPPQKQEAERDMCELRVDLSYRQNMTSILAHAHTRDRSVCWQQGRDECIKSAPPELHHKSVLSLEQLIMFLVQACSDNSVPQPLDFLYNLQRCLLKLAKNSSM